MNPGYEDPSNSAPEQPSAPTYPVVPPPSQTEPAMQSFPPVDPPAPAPLSYPPATAPVAVTQSFPPPAAPVGPGPTASYPPVPAPPTYDPAAVAVPYSAPPISGPYGYGMPIPAPVQEKRGRVGTVVLAVLTTIFVLAAGVLGTLFILKNQEANKLESQVTQLTGETTSQRTRIDTLQKDLDNTKRDLSDAQADTAEITEQKKTIAACVNAIYEYFDAANAAGGRDTPAVRTAETNLNKKCDEANKYLAPTR